MRYQNVCLEAIGYCLPPVVVTSAEIEQQLRPLYERLRLPEGRLELMTGIRERRFWPAGTLPSSPSTQSAQLAISASGIDRSDIGALVHGSVCRDYLEPATACTVHRRLELSSHCVIYDLSNACLGLLNGVLQVANMIELGQIRAGLVVGTEGSRQLVETTIAALNSHETITRQQVKHAFASLTIGSGSCAILLVDRRRSRTGNRILGAALRCETIHHELCQSGRDESVGEGMHPLMHTDSERLLQAGVDVAAAVWPEFLRETGWSAHDCERIIGHQVGQAHRRLLFDRLSLDLSNDFSTVEWLGNTGSVALPMTLALACAAGHIVRHRVACLGIGSGVNCLMLGIDWQTTPPLLEGLATDTSIPG